MRWCYKKVVGGCEKRSGCKRGCCKRNDALVHATALDDLRKLGGITKRVRKPKL